MAGERILMITLGWYFTCFAEIDALEMSIVPKRTGFSSKVNCIYCNVGANQTRNVFVIRQ